MNPEIFVKNAIKSSGMTMKAVSERTNIKYGILESCVNGRRELRADEYLAICSFFKLDPLGFKEQKGA